MEREALRDRYRAERAKRLRPDGVDQYLEPTGAFAHFVDDPYVARVERDPIVEELDVVCIGGGFAGLAAAARIVEAGVTDLRIIEVGGNFGGAWYWNRYPGAMCDTAAMIYLPLLEETNYVPTSKYVMAAEIYQHAQRIADTFGLRDSALLSTSVTSLRWDEALHRWIVETDRGDVLRARFVAAGTGLLHRPKLPGIEGIETFAGHSFHTSRWDYDYTGGDSAGAPMDRLADKRVGIIGTGATSVQCIPHLARSAGELLVFQRTPSSVGERNNRPITDEERASLGPGWQREWLVNFATLQTGGFADVDLVQDGWTDISRRIRDRVVAEVSAGAEFGPETMARAFAESDDEAMDEIRARVDAIVEDPATAEALKPWYNQLCKRPCFHDEYLQAFNEPGVRLIDTDGAGVERIDETGVWVGGVHHPVDCLIFASGFEVGTAQARRSGYETVGRNGVTLTDRWEDGMQSLHGIHVRNFPNFFVVGFAQGANLISNATHNLVESATAIGSVIGHAMRVGAAEVEVSESAEREWVEMIEGGPRPVFGKPDCTPGYYNNEGGPIGRRERLNIGGYALGPVAYFEYMDRWRGSGEFEGLEFSVPV